MSKRPLRLQMPIDELHCYIKHVSRRIATWAKRKGELVPQPCKCGSIDQLEMHHEDYAEPLEITWLCKKCHAARGKEKYVDPFCGQPGEERLNKLILMLRKRRARNKQKHAAAIACCETILLATVRARRAHRSRTKSSELQLYTRIEVAPPPAQDIHHTTPLIISKTEIKLSKKIENPTGVCCCGRTTYRHSRLCDRCSKASHERASNGVTIHVINPKKRKQLPEWSPQ